ncbi:hypothetical protein ACIBLA_22820 [Streptomyces sp. NPDC050433]|uniref:hypothetical protein n=1 Tax=Streptomyces sp. NPDC050433 TaxID=3365615 RepID=UPI0037950B78
MAHDLPVVAVRMQQRRRVRVPYAPCGQAVCVGDALGPLQLGETGAQGRQIAIRCEGGPVGVVQKGAQGGRAGRAGE